MFKLLALHIDQDLQVICSFAHVVEDFQRELSTNPRPRDFRERKNTFHPLGSGAFPNTIGSRLANFWGKPNWSTPLDSVFVAGRTCATMSTMNISLAPSPCSKRTPCHSGDGPRWSKEVFGQMGLQRE